MHALGENPCLSQIHSGSQPADVCASFDHFLPFRIVEDPIVMLSATTGTVQQVMLRALGNM